MHKNMKTFDEFINEGRPNAALVHTSKKDTFNEMSDFAQKSIHSIQSLMYSIQVYRLESPNEFNGVNEKLKNFISYLQNLQYNILKNSDR